MKHGPNALIDEDLPVVILATHDMNDPDSVLRYEKTLSNLKEVKARSGTVIAIATEGDEEIREAADHVLYVPDAPELLAPILEVVPLPVAGVSHRRAARLRRRPTAQSGEVGYGGVKAAIHCSPFALRVNRAPNLPVLDRSYGAAPPCGGRLPPE